MSEQLHRVVEALELSNLEGKHAEQEFILAELYGSAGEKNLFGIPLHFSLLQKGDIIKKVEATGVHLTKIPDSEFALAVRVFAYPIHVFSIWIFVVAVSPSGL